MRKSWLLAPLCVAFAHLVSAEVDATRLIERLKVTPPAKIKFAEIRFSRLLKQPTIVSGELGYLGADQLNRIVESPYRETTEIRSTSVSVARAGEPVRTFALDRTPELRVLLRTFSSLLEGDRAALERDFELSAKGDDENWTLTLSPKDARLKRRLDHIGVAGSRNPRCFSIFFHDGGMSVMLLDPAAVDLSARVTLDSVVARCQPASKPIR